MSDVGVSLWTHECEHNWTKCLGLFSAMWTFLGGSARSAKGSCDVVVVRSLGWKIMWCPILLYDPGCFLDVQNWEQHNRSQEHVAQCNIVAITSIKFPLVFLPSLFTCFLPRHVLSSQCGVSNCTHAPEAPPAPKVPEVPKAPGGFAGCFDMTETFPSLFWMQDSLPFLPHMTRTSLLTHLFLAWRSSFFVAVCNKRKKHPERHTQKKIDLWSRRDIRRRSILLMSDVGVSLWTHECEHNWTKCLGLFSVMWTFSGGSARSAKGSWDVVVVRSLG